MASGSAPRLCPVLRPTRDEFCGTPFATYVGDYFRRNPDAAMVKVRATPPVDGF